MGSIMEYNGGSCVAMTGKNCVAIASDMRLGQQFQSLSGNFPKIFEIHDKLRLGLTGLATDVLTCSKLFRKKANLYALRESRSIQPRTMANLISTSLYERRFGPYFIMPIVAGLKEHTNEPFVCDFDNIGCMNLAKGFVAIGTASEQLLGMCETLYEPDLEPEDLFETISQVLLNAQDRDAFSGWGAEVHIITPTKVIRRQLKTRMD